MIDLKAKPFNLTDEDICWVESTLSSMTVEEKAGQLFCVLFKTAVPEEFDYVFRILNPGACMYRVVPARNAVSASNTLQARSRIPLLNKALGPVGGFVNRSRLRGRP